MLPNLRVPQSLRIRCCLPGTTAGTSLVRLCHWCRMSLMVASSDGDTGIPFPKKGSSPFDVLRQIITERGEINGLYRNLDMVCCRSSQSAGIQLKLVPSQYDFPPSFEQPVFVRDGRCFVTGADTDVGMSWIFPPPWAHQVGISAIEYCGSRRV